MALILSRRNTDIAPQSAGNSTDITTVTMDTRIAKTISEFRGVAMKESYTARA
jgi:hypothetical protein